VPERIGVVVICNRLVPKSIFVLVICNMLVPERIGVLIICNRLEPKSIGVLIICDSWVLVELNCKLVIAEEIKIICSMVFSCIGFPHKNIYVLCSLC
jgi:hypothetical protein